VEVHVALDGRVSELSPARVLPFQDAVGERLDGDGQPILLVVSPIEARLQRDPDFSLSLGTSGASATLGAAELESATVDVKTFLRRWLAPLDCKERNEVVDFLACAAMNATPSVRTGKALLSVRELLRERLMPHNNDPDLPRGLIVEHILQVDERSYFIKGWVYDAEAEIARLTAVSPEGMRVEMSDRFFRDARPDVVEWTNAFGDSPAMKDVGMICLVELPAPSLIHDSWVIEFENEEGTAVEITAPPSQHEERIVRARILAECSAENRRVIDEELMTHHVAPAVTRMQSKTTTVPHIANVTDYGNQPATPDISIIVPLYGTVEYVEAQLGEFADDPDIHASELIYVLDSPELEDHLDYVATSLHPIYNVPFRVAVLERNVGFAGANNAGASIARGRLLLLLNSDVLPDKPGWLSTMRDFYDSKPDIGALAPKLIYEDDSIQHAGMHFYKKPGTDTWLDSQYFKGLHRSFPAANIARSLPAVTGACMMIDKRLYEEHGGLSGHYVQGDYEDFDLCMRLTESGRENWYLPEAELYHLEAQSYTSELRSPSNRYNAWLHSHRWASQIEELIRGAGSDWMAPPTDELANTDRV
jgi:GT2 family glycosyltransferase